MGKKLEGNGLWDSSRMMLPEHREAIVKEQRNLNVKEKPTLGEDAIENIQRVISDSFTYKTEIKLRMFDRFEDLYVIGVVERVDTLTGRVRIDGEWFRMDEMTGATYG